MLVMRGETKYHQAGLTCNDRKISRSPPMIRNASVRFSKAAMGLYQTRWRETRECKCRGIGTNTVRCQSGPWLEQSSLVSLAVVQGLVEPLKVV